MVWRDDYRPAQTAVTGVMTPLSVDICETVGAPSATVIVASPCLPAADASVSYLRLAYRELVRIRAAFTKVLFLAPSRTRGSLRCRFVQLIGAGPDGFARAETGRDCLNSMVAATPRAYRMTGPHGGVETGAVVLRNVDSGLVVAVTSAREGVDIRVVPPTPLVPENAVIAIPNLLAHSLVLRANNPYLLMDGGSLGLSHRELIRLRGVPAPELRRRIRAEVAKVQAVLSLPEMSGLPKVAVLRSDGKRLVARTIYLERWHPGLPLTGAVSFLVAAMITGSPWSHLVTTGKGLAVRTLNEVLQIGVSQDPHNGAIRSFTIHNRKIIIHAEGIAA